MQYSKDGVSKRKSDLKKDAFIRKVLGDKKNKEERERQKQQIFFNARYRGNSFARGR